MERVLAQRIALAWLQVTYADILATQNLARDLSAAQQKLLERRQNQAHQRLLSATKMLATVRKLLPAEAKEESSGEPKNMPSKPRATTLKARKQPEPAKPTHPRGISRKACPVCGE